MRKGAFALRAGPAFFRGWQERFFSERLGNAPHRQMIAVSLCDPQNPAYKLGRGKSALTFQPKRFFFFQSTGLMYFFRKSGRIKARIAVRTISGII